MSADRQLRAEQAVTRIPRPQRAEADREASLSTPDASVRRAQLALSAPHLAVRPEHILALQRVAGNRAVQRLIAARGAPAAGLQRRKPKIPAGVIPSGKLGKLATADETEFRRKVYDKQLQITARDPHKQFLAALPADELDVVEGDHKLRKGTVVEDAKKLLEKARQDLAAEQAQRNPLALKVKAIGIGSAYRSLKTELGAWEKAYKTAFNATKEKREELDDGEFGDEAVKLMAKRMYKYKAIPGYSKHTKGLAIDFSTTQGRTEYGPNGSQKEGWKKTWLYKWLAKHAADFSFEPYSAEPWHWQHTPPAEAEAAPTP